MTGEPLLDDALLTRIRARAADYDAQNRFFDADLADLAEAGYLAALVPTEFGGAGLTLEQLTREQMRLAGAAPATALAVNMHQVWMGVARIVHASGDHSMDFAFTDAVAGEVFGFGISEAGNDLVLFGSTTEARPDGAGGYALHGTKIFTSLSPAWTRLGTFGTDSTDPERPMSVFGFLDRADGGFTIRDDWDTLGMRATQSCTTVLHGAPVRPERVIRRIDPGPAAAQSDAFVFGIFANFEILLAAVYTGIASRALDLAVDAARSRTSLKNAGAPYALDPDIRWRLADAAIELDAIGPQIAALATDLDRYPHGNDRGGLWLPQLSAVKSRATETAMSVVTKAIRAAGGSSYFNRNELSRLHRDVLAGLFHPSDDESVHAAWANALLGPLTPWPSDSGETPGGPPSS